jgi:hypothetical protein
MRHLLATTFPLTGKPYRQPEMNYDADAIVHKLRLTPTKIPNVFQDEDGMTQYVLFPKGHTPEQIRETAVRLIRKRGRSLAEFGL